MITWTDIFNGIGDFFMWTFKGMRALGHIPNVILWCIIASLLVYWVLQMKKHAKDADRNGTLK